MNALLRLVCAALVSAICFDSLGDESASPTPAADCGPYPKLYKEIVWNWMRTNLVDADTAQIQWQAEPACTDLGKHGEHVYGWLVNFKVNARNQFGAYTGFQKHGVLIRGGQVVKGIGFGY